METYGISTLFSPFEAAFLQEILLRANEEEVKKNLNYVGRCEVPLGLVEV